MLTLRAPSQKLKVYTVAAASGSQSFILIHLRPVKRKYPESTLGTLKSRSTLLLCRLFNGGEWLQQPISRPFIQLSAHRSLHSLTSIHLYFCHITSYMAYFLDQHRPCQVHDFPCRDEYPTKPRVYSSGMQQAHNYVVLEMRVHMVLL